MNYDITFCSKEGCSNKECERNQSNIYKNSLHREIWIGNFEKCEYWKGDKHV